MKRINDEDENNKNKNKKKTILILLAQISAETKKNEGMKYEDINQKKKKFY